MILPNSVIESLILDGSIEISSFDEEYGFRYSLTEKIKDQHPELLEEVYQYFWHGLLKLWELGYVIIDFYNSDPTVIINHEKFIESDIDSLDSRERDVIRAIMKYIN